MIIASWNVRGMNSPIKIKEVRNFLVENNISVIGLMETKIKEPNAKKIQKKLGKNWNWTTNYNHHDKGRLWVGRRQDRCKMEICETHHQYIAIKITIFHMTESFHSVFVYGLHNVRDRREMWKGLENLNYNSPCLFIGDYNAIFKEDHRKNGAQVSTYETNDMLQWLENKKLFPIIERGHKYSWSNREKGDNRTLTKIDHVIGNIQWLNSFSQASVLYANPQTSNHTPLILNLTRLAHNQSKPFRFFNYLCEHKDFLQVVSEAWRIKVKGSGLQKIWYKMKNVKASLKSLHIKEFAGIEEKIKAWEETLDKIQNELQSNPTNAEYHQQEKEAITQVRKWRNIENKALLQKARINWIQNRDENSAYFHATIKERRASNSIFELQDKEGKWLKTTQEIQNEITNFYQNLQGSETNILEVINRVTMRKGPQIDNTNSLMLIQDVSEGEIKEALFGINDNKAPGIDGFNACFFKKTWDIIKEDLITAIQDFFSNNAMFPPLNCTSVTLIPKVTNACKVGDFRSIACCTVIYKIISRVLAGRLQRVMGRIIDQAQSGFIPGRQMADNILLAAELIKGYSRKNNSAICMIKMDLRKAYDSISWGFLLSVMEEMGFPPRFVGWIKECVTNVSFSLLVNGTPLKPFEAKKGLRQGDPTSPYLFAIAMEYLSRIPRNQKDSETFHFHPRCRKDNITHLLFVDDLLMFCRADIPSVRSMMLNFKRFSKASGLEANTNKSNVYISGVDT
ncbi:unnamed protein product [Amaranthus hypochondriacus]